MLIIALYVTDERIYYAAFLGYQNSELVAITLAGSENRIQYMDSNGAWIGMVVQQPTYFAPGTSQTFPSHPFTLQWNNIDESEIGMASIHLTVLTH